MTVSMSCTVCLCRSQLVTTPGLSPVLPVLAVSAHLCVIIFPSNNSHKYVVLPDKVSTAFCGVGRVNLFVVGIVSFITCFGGWAFVLACVCVYVYMHKYICIAIVHA